jgi:hypothetical protein
VAKLGCVREVGFIEPMLALPVTKLPEGPARSYELKFDEFARSV